jgi:hypothetical protein
MKTVSFSIKTRNHGEKIFTCLSDGGYVRLNGQQICQKGKLFGNTVFANATTLEKTARAWWRAYLAHERSQ